MVQIKSQSRCEICNRKQYTGTAGLTVFSQRKIEDDTALSAFYAIFDSSMISLRRSKNDKFCLICEIWDRFVLNSQVSYKPDKYLTIDKQLFPCQSRCSFTQYMPDKPDKFGIKFWLLVDVASKFICNGIPYLGKNEVVYLLLGW